MQQEAKSDLNQSETRGEPAPNDGEAAELWQMKLAARDKTITVLKRQLAKRQEQPDLHTPMEMLQQNATMARVVELKTRELEKERAELRRTLDELHRTQAQLLQAQKMESIGQMAAGIAHEINTPTQYVSDNVSFLQSACSGLLRLIDESQKLAEAVRSAPDLAETLDAFEATLKRTKLDFLKSQIPDALEQSLEGLAQIAHIVSAMKEFSHPSRGEKEPINMAELVDTALTVARNEWKYVADIETEFDPDLPPVPCLRNEFSQVMLNLVVNAAHAIGEANQASGREKGLIRVSTGRDNDWFELRVSDNGCGIPKEIRDKIFDPFFTTKAVGKGTGQGLAIVYSTVVDKHQGELRCVSEPGKGTRFIVRLPLHMAAPQASS